MPQIVEILLAPELSMDPEHIARAACIKAGYPITSTIQVKRKSIDARQRQVQIRLQVAVYKTGEVAEPMLIPRDFLHVTGPRSVVIVGGGPAGLFAALRCLEAGVRPIVIERGKDVRARRRDLAAIHKSHIVHPDSNYCFGEGGAGTYSDGKLYTRSTKRGDVSAVLQTLVQFGASEEILIEAHPHIGTNKLPGIISAMRQQILDAGGIVRFETAMADLEVAGNQVKAVITREGERIPADAVILATGHSARDVFHLFQQRKWEIHFKPFAVGVRIEHPQQLIDRIQYHCDVRNEYLPPASYKLVEQTKYGSIFSFCMCPGGIIAPCATNQEEVVTNGWSPSKRNNPWANSGMVVPVDVSQATAFRQYGALAGMKFQESIEHQCWDIAGRTQQAPAQRLTDFVDGRLSKSLPDCSYQPGIVPVRLDNLLPEFITGALREGLKAFGKKMKGYYTDEAVLVAPESRTSSPVRIPRNSDTLMHPELQGLFPCGEGAGYAGGIVSAAIDGDNAATAALRFVMES